MRTVRLANLLSAVILTTGRRLGDSVAFCAMMGE